MKCSFSFNWFKSRFKKMNFNSYYLTSSWLCKCGWFYVLIVHTMFLTVGLTHEKTAVFWSKQHFGSRIQHVVEEGGGAFWECASSFRQTLWLALYQVSEKNQVVNVFALIALQSGMNILSLWSASRVQHLSLV